ncbi:MAG TPA: RHS repeat-associated core domain-containing protein [Tahibacter sp.]|nr:RHS repeat-associated core domain-containing protein [Tahibacter sp.]
MNDLAGRCSRNLSRLALGLLLVAGGMGTSSAQNLSCAAEGGDAQCKKPEISDFACVGTFVTADSHPCSLSPTGTQCKTEGEAIDKAVANFAAGPPPTCGQPSYGGLCPAAWNPETFTYKLGVLQSSSRAYVATVPHIVDNQCEFHTFSECGNVNAPNGFIGAIGNCQRSVTCPPGSAESGGTCKSFRSGVCSINNPMDCVTGEKTQVEKDIADSGPLEFIRYYTSFGFYEPRGSEPTGPDARHYRILGPNWRHTYQRAIQAEPAVAGQPAMVTATRPDNDYRQFRFVGGVWVGSTDRPETLEEIVSLGQRTGWRYLNADNVVEQYDADGRLLSLVYPSGGVLSMSYSSATTPATTAPFPGLLIEVADQAGRRLQLSYDSLARLVRLTGEDGSEHAYAYSATHALTSVTRPDTTVRTYLYNEPAHNANYYAGTLLTGIVDENGQRYATYRYSHNKVNDEWHGSAYADRLQITYSSGSNPPYYYARTTGALGNFEQRDLIFVNGSIRQKARKRCTSYNCATVLSERAATYDVNGNIDTRTDDNGSVTDYTYDTRNRETRRIEAANAAGVHAASKRTIETDWHASWRLPVERRTFDSTNTLVARTQWKYNLRGQPVARCEVDVNDAAALAYVCSETTAPSAAAKVRRWTYAYCEAADVALPGSTCPVLGYAKSVDGPRSASDAGMNAQEDITGYSYYAATDESGCGMAAGPCHRKGDLWKTTNALGQVEEVVAYDKVGRKTLVRDANGTLTGSGYDERGRLVAWIVYAKATPTSWPDDAKTLLDYDGVGNLVRLEHPDGVALNYVYDDAHRLTDIIDADGNRIHYTLDAVGNRVGEAVYDASYNPATPGQGLKRALTREYNVLRRLVRSLDANGVVTRDSSPYDSGGLLDGYDGAGYEVQVKDGLGTQMQRAYDPLNRLVRMIGDYAGTDAETANATSEYGYDALDNLRTVKDAASQTTTYTYDGLGNRTAVDSPDTGYADYAYDRNGNLVGETDNRGIASTRTYDALNRLRAIAYPTSALDVAYHYDESNATTGCASSYPQGRLTRMTDAGGTTTYCYDRRGNVTRKAQLSGGITLSVDYTYTPADRIATITYPGGGIAGYAYDGTGHINRLTWKSSPTASAIDVIGSVSYYPFGPANVLTYGNGRLQTRTYDQNYLIDSIASSATGGFVVDFGLDAMGNVVGAQSGFGLGGAQRVYVYDRLQRLTRVEDGAGQTLEDYGYNKAGDRTQKQFAGQPLQSYAYLGGTHRLGSVAGVGRSYDANGNTTGRGDGVTLGYDDTNRLSGATATGSATSYVYSGRDERTQKVVSVGGAVTTSRFLFDPAGQLLAEEIQVDGGKKSRNVYLFVGDLPVAVLRGTSLSYLESDHLGTPRVAANPATDAAEWYWDLLGSGFGEHAATTVVSGKSLALRYPGQYHDAETGLSYNYRRDYEAATGRYVQSDPIGLATSLATYAYVDSNPLKFIDPYGLAKWTGGMLSGGLQAGTAAVVNLHSPCPNGGRAWATVLLYGGQFTPGPPLAFTGSGLELVDGSTVPNPDVFEGYWGFSALSYVIGFGPQYGNMFIGGAHGTPGFSAAAGFNVSFGAGGGVSNVTKKRYCKDKDNDDEECRR